MGWTVAIGVDTHKDVHVAVACDRNGSQLDACEIAPRTDGYASLLAWAERLGRPAFAIEGCGSYGAGLARFLAAAGVPGWESERPRRRERRRGQSDLIDAALAARRLISGEGLSLPRGGGGSRDQLRLLLLERRGVVQARTAALNQLQAAAPTLPQRLRTLGGEKLLRACLQLRPTTIEHTIMRRLARRVRQLGAELADVDAQLSTCISSLAPQLTSERGVGVTCAAQLLVSSGDPARMHSERPSPPSPAPAPSTRPAAGNSATGSTAAATANSTVPCT